MPFRKDHLQLVTDAGATLDIGWDYGTPYSLDPINGVDVGNFWIKTLRVGPHPIEGGSGTFPDVEMYFLPVQCQHCENPECVKVCPTEASHVAEDGTIQIDKDKCIGCQFCAMACPYGVRYLNEEGRVEGLGDLSLASVQAGEVDQRGIAGIRHLEHLLSQLSTGQ